MPNEGGFIVIRRSVEDWQYWGCESAVAIWVHILMRANWKDGWFMGTPVPRGSFATSVQNFADEVGVHKSTMRRWLKKFEEAGQIEVKATNKFTLINVINYAKYQDVPMVGEQTKEQSKEHSNEQTSEHSVDKQMNNPVIPNRTKKQENKNNKETNILNTFAQSDSGNPSAPKGKPEEELANVAEIYLNDGSAWRPTAKDFERFKKLYPGIDVDQEFRNMSGWSLSNPTKRKTKSGVMRYVNAWLSKAQNQGGSKLHLQPVEPEKGKLPF